MTSIAVYNSSCFDLLENPDLLPDNSVQLFLLDLPYGCTDAEWDVAIDLERMWRGIKRTITQTGVVVFFCTTRFGNDIINSNRKWFRFDLVWNKILPRGFLNCRVRPMVSHEMIYVFSQNSKYTYNPQKRGTLKDNPKTIIRHKSSGSQLYNPSVDSWKHTDNGLRHPLSIVDFKVKTTTNSKQAKYKRWHPTEKPIDLLEWLIKSFSNEGDMVCDFCAGSSSTGVAAYRTNRHYIGSEMDETIFNTSIERLETDLMIKMEITE
jgi:site-specific DNA-methyltransferase (adenine-specific)